MVLCEDTRTSSVLLKHFEVQNRLVAHHKFNEHGTAAGLVERLKAGAVIALVSDAGTPGISDPGFLLAREAIERTALRPLLLRGFPAAKEGTPDDAGASQDRGTDDDFL